MIDWTYLILIFVYCVFLNGIFYQGGGLFVILGEDTGSGELDGGSLLGLWYDHLYVTGTLLSLGQTPLYSYDL